MSEGTSSTETTPNPVLTEEEIENRGLTLLATGGPSPALDVVFVHGLQGHPGHTWTYTSDSRSKSGQSSEPRTSRLNFWRNSKESASSSIEARKLFVTTPYIGRQDSLLTTYHTLAFSPTDTTLKLAISLMDPPTKIRLQKMGVLF